MAATSMIEVVFVLGLAATVAGIAGAEGARSIDESRGSSAARYVASRLQQARMEAITGNAATAIRVSTAGAGYSFAAYVDGNGNGVLSRDITSGIDRPLHGGESLGDNFTGVEFGTLPGLPSVDPATAAPGANPIRIGASSGVTFTPMGTSSPGSLYILTRGGAQFVVRIFAETGRTRILRFVPGPNQWQPIAGA